jgi:hypothetical protein
MSISAGDPTYMNPSAGWTTQSNRGTGTGPCNGGVVTGILGWTAATVTGVQQYPAGGASGPMSATYADPSLSGAVSETWEHRLLLGNIPPSSQADPRQGVY